MNILTILVLAVFALCVFSRYQKGFLKTAFSLVSWIVVLVLCNFATPIVTDLLIQNTEIKEVVETTVQENIMDFVDFLKKYWDEIVDFIDVIYAKIKEYLLAQEEAE